MSDKILIEFTDITAFNTWHDAQKLLLGIPFKGTNYKDETQFAKPGTSSYTEALENPDTNDDRVICWVDRDDADVTGLKEISFDDAVAQGWKEYLIDDFTLSGKISGGRK